MENLHLILRHISRSGSKHLWVWDFGENFEFTATSQTDIPTIRKASVADFLQTVHPDDRFGLTSKLCIFAGNKREGIVCRFRTNYFSEDYQGYEMSGEAMLVDEDDSIFKGVGFLQDLNEGDSECLLNQETEAEEDVKTPGADRKMALDNLITALIHINNDFVVQWSSMKMMENILGKNSYAEGSQCYRTTFGRDAPCPNCPVKRMFESQQTETERINMSGEVIEVTANPVYHSGKIIGGILKLDKITERVKQESAIRRLNALMGQILDKIPVYLYVKDPNENFKYVYLNEMQAKIIGLPASEIIGHTNEEIFGNRKDISLFVEHDMQVLEQGGQQAFIEEYIQPGGKKMVLNSLKTVIPGNTGQKPWVMGFSWDITEMKQTEQDLIRLKNKAEESNRLKSSFLANISHEIRTPLNAIVGFSELVCDLGPGEEKSDYISIIKRNNHLLLQLISDILDLSKIETETFEFVFSYVDVFKVINQLVTTQNSAEGITVPVIFDPSPTDCFLYTDENRLTQVLFNLINNAVKFTPTGEVRVGYHLVGEDQIGFYVKDTGVGIAASRVEEIFDRFTKLDKFKQGSGIGLPISRSIIEQLGGSIGVDSELGKGSRFWFVLPYNKKDS